MKKFFTFILVFFMVFNLMPNLPLAYGDGTAVWDGSRTSEPSVKSTVYQISSGAELAWFRDQINAGTGTAYNAVLTNNIDLGGNQWTPMGNATYPYAGTFDGGGNSIQNLCIGTSDAYRAENDSGLFGRVDTNGVVQNLTIVSGAIYAAGKTGAIVGYCYGSVSNCKNKINVFSNDSSVGGIVGFLKGSIDSCCNSGSIDSLYTGTRSRIGGIVGYATKNRDDDNKYSNISNCYNTGCISSDTEAVGGIIGYISYSNVSNCYNTGTVSTGVNHGGVTGYKHAMGTLENCYYLEGTLEDANAVSKTSEKMQAAGFISLLGVAFIQDIENINSGYPILTFQHEEAQEAETPIFGTNLSTNAVEYIVNDTADALMVEVNVSDGGTISYQWYRNMENRTDGAIKIDGETSTSYTPSTDSAGTTYYYVAATNTLGDSTTTAISDIAAVKVNGDHQSAEAPVFETNLSTDTVEYNVDDTANALSVYASVSDGGTISYQWYSNTESRTDSAIDIDGETSTSYTPSTDSSGTIYYYVTATNRTATAISNMACIKVESNTGAQEADKTALQAAIDSVTGENADNFYRTEDRWNGIQTCENGFWNDMQPALIYANTVNDNTSALQSIVDAAAADLQAAIQKLIPITNVNATLLYEKTLLAETKMESDYTDSSWSAMQTELKAAKAMLDALYDDGSPTKLNVAAFNGDGSVDAAKSYQDEVDAQTDVLIAAIKALDDECNKYQLETAQMAYNTIPVLANKLFNSNYMSASDYADGYDDFIAARTAALAFYNSHSEPTEGIGENEATNYVNACETLWSACYKKLVPAGNINVNLSVVDNYVVYDDDEVVVKDAAGNYGELKLSGGATLDDALIQVLGDNYQSTWINGRPQDACKIFVYINGVSVKDPSFSTQNPPASYGYTDIRLKDGDKVTIALTAIPTYYNLSGSLTPYSLNEVGGGNIKYQWFEQDGQEVVSLTTESGQAFTLTSKVQAAISSGYTGNGFALEGAEVYISKCFKTEAEALTEAATVNTGVETGLDGRFTYMLYAEGYYLLTIYDKSDNGALTNGAPILVHVTTSSNPEDVKVALKTELDKVYNAYSQEYFSTDDWSKIEKIYQTGIDGISNAATIGEAAESQLTAIKAIKGVQDVQTADNTKKMSDFKNLLNRLPDDMSKLCSSVEHLIVGYTLYDEYYDGLIEQYAKLTDYQKGLLTKGEQAKYDAVIATYNKKLPKLNPYKLNIVIEADTLAAETALADMTAYLQKYGIDGYCDGENTINTFSTYMRRPDFYIKHTDDCNDGLTYGKLVNSLVTKAVTADPDSWVTLMFDPGYAAYNLIDPDGIYGGPNLVTGDGWSIDGSQMTHSDYYGSYYELLHNATININGEPYEVKSVSFNGVEEYDSFYARSVTKFEVDSAIVGRDIRVPEAIYRFAMPYNDVTATVKWGPVAGSSAEQAADALTDAFDEYSRRDYTDENWALLVAKYNDGIVSIKSAVGEEGINEAKQAALAAMAAVEKKDVSAPVTNERGTVVGEVKIIVENTTFTSPEDGDTPGWTGTLLDGWYDLYDSDSMMTAVLHALNEEGCTWQGTGGSGKKPDYDIKYLASITKSSGNSLSEFDGYRGSGWMGTLNDWFVNLGFDEFTYENEKLQDGDTIHVMFTTNLGVDLGGTWGNSDTTLKDLRVSGGTLTPSFEKKESAGETYEYSLVISGNSSRVKVTPTATNKNYLVKTYLNDKNIKGKEGNTYYKLTEKIPVRLGDTIYIGVGEHDWPSMNNQETEARNYKGTWYALHIISANNGASYVNQVITDLPVVSKISMNNYEDYRDAIEYARTIYNALNTTEQAKVELTRLIAAEEKLVFYDEIQNVKDLLSEIPRVSKVTLSHKSAVMAADAAYKALDDEQKLYITVGNVVNYNVAIEKLTQLGAFKTGHKPSTIVGSDEEPEEAANEEATLKLKAKVSNGKAEAKVTKESLDEIVKEAKNKDISNITIIPEIEGEVGKVKVTLPRDSVSSMANQDNMSMKICAGIADIAMPKEVLTKIAKESGSDVNINVEKLETASLSEENKALVGNRPVYDFSVTVGNKSVSSLGGKVTVSVPYTPQPGEDTRKLTVYYIDDNGKAVEMEGASYDKETKTIVFETDHFSVYAVAYDENKRVIEFTDVADTHWAKEYIYYLAEKGIINGKYENIFAPEDSITRAEFATLLARISSDDMPAAVDKFVDVSPTSWYARNVAWAVNAGITMGTSENTYSPDNMITRQDMAVMISRYAAYKGFSLPADISAKTFTDQAQIRDFAKDAVSAMQQAGIISGRENDIFAPLDKATRAEVAKMLTVLMKMMSE